MDHDWPLTLDQTGPVWSWFDPAQYALNDGTAALAARAGAEAALDDYLQRGAALGYAPNLFFDPAFYKLANPDIMELIGSEDFPTPYDHYSRVGWLDRDPHWLFNLSFYERTYRDLIPEVVAPLGGLYGHFLHETRRLCRAADWRGSGRFLGQPCASRPCSHPGSGSWLRSSVPDPQRRDAYAALALHRDDPVWRGQGHV